MSTGGEIFALLALWAGFMGAGFMQWGTGLVDTKAGGRVTTLGLVLLVLSFILAGSAYYEAWKV